MGINPTARQEEAATRQEGSNAIGTDIQRGDNYHGMLMGFHASGKTNGSMSMNQSCYSVVSRSAVCGALGAVLALATAASAADATAKPKEALPPGIELTSIEVQPQSIELGTKYAYAQVLVTGRLASGEQIDLTRMANVSGASDVVTVSPTGVVRPTADGAGELKWTVAGRTLSVPT